MFSTDDYGIDFAVLRGGRNMVLEDLEEQVCYGCC